MNNLTLGNDDFAYYETLGGGQGACPDADGPERRARRDVEHAQHAGRGARARVPAARRRATRCGASRAATGAHRGGDGVVRELEALADMRYSLLTERRRHAPPGADGGEPGERGRNLLDGEELPPKATGEPARRPAAADRDTGRWRAWRVTSRGLHRAGHHGLAPGGQPGQGGLRADGLQPHARARRGSGRPSTAGTSRARPREVAERSDVVITMVVDGAQVEAMLLGEDGALVGRARGHAVRRHVDDRAGDRALAGRDDSPAQGHAFVDAPVTGSSPKAEAGTLTIMAAAPRPTWSARGRCSR